MTTDANLKDILRKVYMNYFLDGWWDMLLGLFLISWGLAMYADVAWLPGIVFISLYSITWPLKRRFTYPRIGQAKITEERRQATKLLILGAVLFVLGTFVFGIFMAGSRPSWLVEYFILFFGGMIAVVICFLAYWWKANWWYAYAAMLFISVSCHQWLGFPLQWSFIVPGAVILAVGIALLVRFLRKYPELSLEENDGGR
jgi:ABC-type Co2+ transport system permease subunit